MTEIVNDMDEVTADNVEEAIRLIQTHKINLDDYGNPARDWFVERQGINYDLKRLFRVAYEVHFEEQRERPFHTKHARPIFERLGFNVVNLSVKKSKTSSLTEGQQVERTVQTYTRNKKARERCLEHFGEKCQVCGTTAEKAYGRPVNGFIHVHHRKCLSESKAPDKVDPEKDLVPVCPNCHAVIHAHPAQVRTINEVREMRKAAKIARQQSRAEEKTAKNE